jgi:hypothetical protein
MNEPTNVRQVLTCDCGKRHLAAHASPISVCACGRRLGMRLWQDDAKQEPAPEARPAS